MLEAVWLMVRIAAVGAVTANLIAMWKANRPEPPKPPEPPCHSCRWLVKRGGGGVYEYRCRPEGRLSDGFNTPPKYCSYYEKREAAEPPKSEEKITIERADELATKLLQNMIEAAAMKRVNAGEQVKCGECKYWDVSMAKTIYDGVCTKYGTPMDGRMACSFGEKRS